MDLIQIKFNGSMLGATADKHIVVKDICESIGIEYQRQYKKLKSDPTYEAKLLDVQTNGGVQKVFCIPLEKLNGWLFTINPNKVKPEVKEKLIAYKNECFKVLYEHFNKKQNKNLPYIHQIERENIELKRAMNRLLLREEDKSLKEENKELKYEVDRLKLELVKIKDMLHDIAQKGFPLADTVYKLYCITNRFQTLSNIAKDGKNLNTDTKAGLEYWHEKYKEIIDEAYEKQKLGDQPSLC